MTQAASSIEARGAARRWLEDSHAWTERELARAFAQPGRALEGAPERIAEAVRYSLLGGGKRVRPALVRLFCAQHGGTDADALPAALALECVHTYSLVHDDLPCMDDDDLRRGRPTTHKVFGEALAVLAGDALLTIAFELVAGAPRDPAASVRVLARAAGAAGMVGGQVLDLGTSGNHPARLDVERIHALKTAALFGAACELGALAALGSVADGRTTAAREYGAALGLCFQATDDVLDVTASSAALGKTAGKDARQAKPTLVAAIGLDAARAESARLAERARNAAASLGEPPAALRGVAGGFVELLLERDA